MYGEIQRSVCWLNRALGKVNGQGSESCAALLGHWHLGIIKKSVEEFLGDLELSVAGSVAVRQILRDGVHAFGVTDCHPEDRTICTNAHAPVKAWQMPDRYCVDLSAICMAAERQRVVATALRRRALQPVMEAFHYEGG